jgi:hypothetical protein
VADHALAAGSLTIQWGVVQVRVRIAPFLKVGLRSIGVETVFPFHGFSICLLIFQSVCRQDSGGEGEP